MRHPSLAHHRAAAVLGYAAQYAGEAGGAGGGLGVSFMLSLQKFGRIDDDRITIASCIINICLSGVVFGGTITRLIIVWCGRSTCEECAFSLIRRLSF